MPSPQKGPVQISIPAGKSVIALFATDAANTAVVTITDSRNNVVYTATGGGTGPKIHNSSVFVASLGGIYKVSITATPSGNSLSILYNETALVTNGEVYAQSNTFVCEDAGDNDYNDVYLSVSWFQYTG